MLSITLVTPENSWEISCVILEGPKVCDLDSRMEGPSARDMHSLSCLALRNVVNMHDACPLCKRAT